MDDTLNLLESDDRLQQHAVAMAQRYKQHLNGYAYIPLQDIVRYEQAVHLVYG